MLGKRHPFTTTPSSVVQACPPGGGLSSEADFAWIFLSLFSSENF
uniref:Uncharacterized protein n=1 Tax=Anguilla anguilla TaxID=7936 RepID=A0A0E9UJQ9_ANGAN